MPNIEPHMHEQDRSGIMAAHRNPVRSMWATAIFMMALAFASHASADFDNANQFKVAASHQPLTAAAKPCIKLDTPDPIHKKCNRIVGSSAANGRTRSDDDGLPAAIGRLAVALPWNVNQSRDSRASDHRAGDWALLRRRRAPFWAAYASTSRMLN